MLLHDQVEDKIQLSQLHIGIYDAPLAFIVDLHFVDRVEQLIKELDILALLERFNQDDANLTVKDVLIFNILVDDLDLFVVRFANIQQALDNLEVLIDYNLVSLEYSLINILILTTLAVLDQHIIRDEVPLELLVDHLVEHINQFLTLLVLRVEVDQGIVGNLVLGLVQILHPLDDLQDLLVQVLEIIRTLDLLDQCLQNYVE